MLRSARAGGKVIPEDPDARRLAIEERRLDLEERLAAAEAESGARRRTQEDRQTRITLATIAVSVFVPLMVAAVAYWSTSSNEAAQARRNFELEAARIVLGAESPAAAFHKAEMLKALFPDKLSPEFATQFEPSGFETYSTAGSKREVLNLLLAHPGQEAQIVAWWARLFPADAEGTFSFLPAFAEGALTPKERRKLLESIREQIDR